MLLLVAYFHFPVLGAAIQKKEEHDEGSALSLYGGSTDGVVLRSSPSNPQLALKRIMLIIQI